MILKKTRWKAPDMSQVSEEKMMTDSHVDNCFVCIFYS